MKKKPKRDKAFLDRAYNPAEVEEGWYDYWMDEDLFSPEADAKRRGFNGKQYCIVVPPPNITGGLHIGHSLNFTLQDVTIRFRRMQGYETLWLPGYDHAGIATQMIVSNQLRKKGINREDLGRDKFLEKIWEWKELNSHQIIEQIQQMGCALDWKRTRFTLDDMLSRAVREVFVRLYEKGDIYRGTYIVNWCPSCATAISDLEVNHKDVEGAFWDIAYPLADGSGEVVVSTTRPETMLADTAVAVNPADARYKHLVGKKVMLPLMDIEIPIIADEYVGIELGTGCLKVTPAHDPNDYEIGLRHRLAAPKCIGPDGKMTELFQPLKGMDRFEARKAVLDMLKERELLRGEKKHIHPVGHCFRCATMVEPMVSEQWFLKMDRIVKPAIKVVEEGGVQLITDKWNKVYFDWLENIRDWCISRQLWWGHRIPAWYCPNGHTTVAREEPASCATCGSHELKQDEDVLDTWFSSALWPFSTMGWPDETEDLKKFYPSDVLVTAFDILFFWVARMIIMGMEFMGEIPFHYVLLHGLVRDEKGEKMSRTKGNAIDPMDAIKEHGRDVLRFMLNHHSFRGKQDFTVTPDRLKSARFFINKIWNASKFVLMNLGDDFVYKGIPDGIKLDELSLADRWILARLDEVIDEYTRNMGDFDFGFASNLLYSFIWDEFCDWYLEAVKPGLSSGDEATKNRIRHILYYCLTTILRLYSPVMPFVTEEIYRELPGADSGSLTIQAWPELLGLDIEGDEAKEQFHLLSKFIKAARNLKKEIGLPDNRKVDVIIRAGGDNKKLLEEQKDIFINLAKVGNIQYMDLPDPRPQGALFNLVDGSEIYLIVEDINALKAEFERLKKKVAEKESYVQKLDAKIKSEEFIAKAPKDVLEKEFEKLAVARGDLEELKKRCERIKEVIG